LIYETDFIKDIAPSEYKVRITNEEYPGFIEIVKEYPY